MSGQCEAGSAIGRVSQEEEEACLGSCLQPLPRWFLQYVDIISLMDDGNGRDKGLPCCLQPLSFLVFGFLDKWNPGPALGESLLREEKKEKHYQEIIVPL